MLFQGQVINSVAAVRASGNPNALQLPLGELAVSEVAPRYSNLAQSGLMYVAHAAAVLTSLAGAAMVGLQLWNRSSTKNLHLMKAAGYETVTSAAATGFQLAFGTAQTSAPTGQTAVSGTTNCLLGGSASAALALNAGTFLLAPTAIWDLEHRAVAIATTGEDPGYQMDFEGSIVVPPNAWVAVVAIGAASAGAHHSFMWAELPI